MKLNIAIFSIFVLMILFIIGCQKEKPSTSSSSSRVTGEENSVYPEPQPLKNDSLWDGPVNDSTSALLWGYHDSTVNGNGDTCVINHQVMWNIAFDDNSLLDWPGSAEDCDIAKIRISKSVLKILAIADTSHFNSFVRMIYNKKTYTDGDTVGIVIESFFKARCNLELYPSIWPIVEAYMNENGDDQKGGSIDYAFRNIPDSLFLDAVELRTILDDSTRDAYEFWVNQRWHGYDSIMAVVLQRAVSVANPQLLEAEKRRKTNFYSIKRSQAANFLWLPQTIPFFSLNLLDDAVLLLAQPSPELIQSFISWSTSDLSPQILWRRLLTLNDSRFDGRLTYFALIKNNDGRYTWKEGNPFPKFAISLGCMQEEFLSELFFNAGDTTIATVGFTALSNDITKSGKTPGECFASKCIGKSVVRREKMDKKIELVIRRLSLPPQEKTLKNLVSIDSIAYNPPDGEAYPNGFYIENFDTNGLDIGKNAVLWQQGNSEIHVIYIEKSILIGITSSGDSTIIANFAYTTSSCDGDGTLVCPTTAEPLFSDVDGDGDYDLILNGSCFLRVSGVKFEMSK